MVSAQQGVDGPFFHVGSSAAVGWLTAFRALCGCPSLGPSTAHESRTRCGVPRLIEASPVLGLQHSHTQNPTTGVVPSLFHWGIPGEMTFSPINSQRVYSVALLGSRRWPGRGAKRIGWAGSERPGLRSGLCLTLPQPIRGR